MVEEGADRGSSGRTLWEAEMAEFKRATFNPMWTGWPYEQTCPMCGKVFCVRVLEEWAYRRPEGMCCSWSCMKKPGEQLIPEKRGRKPGKHQSERLEMIRTLKEKGMSQAQIERATGYSKQLVSYHWRRIEDAKENGVKT